MSRQPLYCAFPNFFGHCDKCPLGNMTSKKCVWQTIKKYYMEEREKAQTENPEDIYRERRTKPFMTNIHIVAFSSPTPEITQFFGQYDSRVWTILELAEILEKVTCFCGRRFTRYDLKMHPHEKGMFVRLNDGTVAKMWTYGHCQTCQNDLAFWKIFHQLGRPS